ncbi:MAG: YggS family pyridoxal phosphate-dependent enzyme [Dehalococcoidia bacterium]|nr:YggS family pyridoxal phosphate-dependent enzyme [Dehalococcoidia bacterium]
MTAPGPATDSIAAGVQRVRARIHDACARAGRDVGSVTLIAATKTHSAAALVELIAAGVADIGENYVQEGAAKIEALAPLLGAAGLPMPRPHFIGQLQRNKVRAALAAFDVLHAVDSVRLVEAIERAEPTTAVPCFIQVNLSGETSKGGICREELPSLVAKMQASAATELLGLMMVPPAGPSEASRAWFRRLQMLASEHGLSHCSMGMTGDFEVAIEEGATHVRVGRAIFGERQH